MASSLPTLKVHVEQDVKDAFLALAAKRGKSQAALLKQLVAQAMASPADSQVEAPIDRQQLKNVSVYLPEFLKRAVVARAKSKAMTSSGWIGALIQSALMREPVMTHNQLAALNTSARELAAIGRNINQIAKALNERPGDATMIKIDELRAVRREIESNRDSIRRLVRASQQAWGEE